jgi:DNA-directed RNA polymerase subunit RPC12/RpoP
MRGEEMTEEHKDNIIRCPSCGEENHIWPIEEGYPNSPYWCAKCDKDFQPFIMNEQEKTNMMIADIKKTGDAAGLSVLAEECRKKREQYRLLCMRGLAAGTIAVGTAVADKLAGAVVGAGLQAFFPGFYKILKRHNLNPGKGLER